MSRRIIVPLLIIILSLSMFISCRNTYFYVTEEANSHEKVRFTYTKSYYMQDKSIELTNSRYEIIPGDSLMMFIEGEAKTAAVGEAGVMELAFSERTLIYISLPKEIYEETYPITHASICEVLNSLKYDYGENVFTCQNGRVVVDSIRKTDIYGTVTGDYINTSNQTLTLEAPFKSKLKKK